jgi:hypothetical protein
VAFSPAAFAFAFEFAFALELEFRLPFPSLPAVDVSNLTAAQ